MKRAHWTGIGALFAAVLIAAGPAESPVADAAAKGDVETVRSLLRDGADVNAAQGDGMSALHWAAERGDVALMDVLLYAGAELEASTRIGHYRPLHIAARNGKARRSFFSSRRNRQFRTPRRTRKPNISRACSYCFVAR